MLLDVNFVVLLLVDLIAIVVVLVVTFLGKQLKNEPYRWVVVNIMLADFIMLVFFANGDPRSPIRRYFGDGGAINLEKTYQSVNIYTRIMRWMLSYFPMAMIFLVIDAILAFSMPSIRQNKRLMTGFSIAIIATINFIPAALFLIEVFTSNGYSTTAKEATMKFEPLGFFELSTVFVCGFFLGVLQVVILQIAIFALFYTFCCTRRNRPIIKKRIWYFVDMILLGPLSGIVLLVQGPQFFWTGATVVMKLIPRIYQMLDPDDIPSMTPEQLQQMVALVNEIGDSQSAFIALTPITHCVCLILFNRAYLEQIIAFFSCGQLIFKHRAHQIVSIKKTWAQRIDNVIPISRNIKNGLVQSSSANGKMELTDAQSTSTP